jgi:hypothetical protein
MKWRFGMTRFRFWRRRKAIPLAHPQVLHWTKLDKPLREMSPEERRAAAEKIALESLKALTKDKT